MLTQLIQCAIGEESEVSGWNSFVDRTRNVSRDDVRDGYDEDEDRAPIIIVIDNAQNMCPTSWDLLESICEECYRICIILLM